MNKKQKRSLTAEEKQRLISFFALLIQIDRRERVTKTAQQIHIKNIVSSN